jgi:response regulator RpfG family c-di-GMP phosphodiesterase
LNPEVSIKTDKTSVLVVDDEPQIVSTYKRILSLKGFNAEGANSGKEALQKMGERDWDIIIADLELKDTNGLRILAEANKLTPPPVTIILTGYATIDSAMQAIRFGAAAYLLKPCEFEQIEAAIFQGLAKRNFNLKLQEEISIYNDLALAINSSLDLHEIFRVTLKKILEVLYLDAGAIYIFDAKTQSLELVNSEGLPIEPVDERRRFSGKGLAGEVAAKERIVINEDTTTHRVELRKNSTPFLSSIGIPLKAKDQFKGVMTLFSKGGRIFRPSDLRLLNTVSMQLSVALENSQLYENLSNRLKEREVLYEIDQGLVRSLELDAFLPHMLQIIREGFGYSNGSILIFDPEQNVLRVRAASGYLSSGIQVDVVAVGEGSVTGMAALRREVINVPDVSAYPHYLKVAEATRSEIAIPMILGDELLGVFDLESSKLEAFSEKDQNLLSTIARQTAVVIKNTNLYQQLALTNKELEESFVAFMQSLGATIEAKDPYTEGHVRRASNYAVSIARALNLPETEVKNILYGAALHDLGKLAVPDSILKKPRQLTEKEWEIMRTHPQRGVEIIEGVKFLEGVKPIILHHQERYDGLTDGKYPAYPAGIKGEAIPIGARIIAVVDAYDAITTTRPYRRGLSKEEAFRRLREGSGTQFDPTIVELFIKQIESEEQPGRRKEVKVFRRKDAKNAKV